MITIIKLPIMGRLPVTILTVIAVIGASLSEPHIDELNVRNLYMVYILLWYAYVTRAPPYTLYSNSRYIPEAA